MNSLIDRIENLLPAKKIKIMEAQSSVLKALPYYFFPLLIGTAYFCGMRSPFTFLVFIYGVIPLLDEYYSLDELNPTKQQTGQLNEQNWRFLLPLYATIILDWLFFFKIMSDFSTMEVGFHNCFRIAFSVFILSNLNAAQFTLAHEVFHKPGIWNKLIGTLHMTKLLYIHFTSQHLYGHHRHVSTPADAASAPKGMNFYKFLPRSFFGSYRSVYKMDSEANKPFYMNMAVISVLSSIAFTTGVYMVYGKQSCVFFLAIAAGAIIYLQGINYIEHYGLQREKLPNGEYEKVNIRHSWNAPQRFSNYLLFKLQRHSDHHENSMKPYQTLLSFKESPCLPHGYTLMILMCMFPPLWFSVMDPLVELYMSKKEGLINDKEVSHEAFIATRRFSIASTLFFTGAGLANALIFG